MHIHVWRFREKIAQCSERIYYASHLLQANYDIRTIQELLGHSNLKTNMAYPVKSQAIKEARSPLDFHQ